MKSVCLNDKCYIKNESFTLPTQSYEHIIPNALGGHLKSKFLICKEINTGLFSKLDAELSNRIEISKFIKFKREDGKEQPELTGISKEGFKYSVNNNKEGTLQSFKPIGFIDDNGNDCIKFPIHQKKEIIDSYLKKNPLLKEEDIIISLEEEDINHVLYFKYNLGIIDSIDSFRAIAKIATNFAILNNLNRSEILNFIDFIKGGSFDKILLGYFYPKELLEYEFGNDEISHIIYLRGCTKENLLYCYIELFNTHCFVIILNQYYNGDDFVYSYIWDLLNTKITKKSISMNLKRDFMLARGYFFDNTVNEDYKDRLLRISEISGFRLFLK